MGSCTWIMKHMGYRVGAAQQEQEKEPEVDPVQQVQHGVLALHDGVGSLHNGLGFVSGRIDELEGQMKEMMSALKKVSSKLEQQQQGGLKPLPAPKKITLPPPPSLGQLPGKGGGGGGFGRF